MDDEEVDDDDGADQRGAQPHVRMCVSIQPEAIRTRRIRNEFLWSASPSYSPVDRG